ncbi:Amidase [Macrophomina phaseolina MS6]|uniref:Amidase n=1 Tax=Macrophomina phaseolina (strain MS6) TaxID=1126212 RepID=K2RJ00_MACPH|nr:Amidase [Macrophomina phaseolina MS6]
MSVVFLSSGPPTVDIERLRAIATKHNVRVPAEEEDHYRHLLNGLDATADQIKNLPEYEDPRLRIDPGSLPRAWSKPAANPLNAWSHRVSFVVFWSYCFKMHHVVAFKDNVSIGGIPITGGTFPELLTGQSSYPVPNIDAIVVSRVLQSSGTVLGSATCEHFSMSPLSFTSATGCVRNPWLPSHTAGGSSSGCGALVAIGALKAWRTRHGLPSMDAALGDGVDMAVGGDQGGSIRIPACYNGIYGLKPTHGLIPYTGIISLFPMIDHTGPMTATLEDCASLLGVLAGYDGIDPRCTPETPLREHVQDYLGEMEAWKAAKQDKGEWTPKLAGRGLRIGVVKEAFEVMGLSAEVANVVRAAIEQFKSVGAEVEEVSVPEHLIGPSIWTVATRAGIGPYGLRNVPPPFLGHHLAHITPPALTQEAFDTLNRHNPAVANMWFNSALMLDRPDCNQLVGKAMSLATQLRAAYDRAFEEGKFDVLLTPVNPRVGSKHPTYDMNVEEKMQPAIGATLNTCQFNVTGRECPSGWLR